MNPVELIGDVFVRYLDTTIERENDEGTARLMIDHLSPHQTVAIAEAVLSHNEWKNVVDLKLNRDFIGDSDLPDEVLRQVYSENARRIFGLD